MASETADGEVVKTSIHIWFKLLTIVVGVVNVGIIAFAFVNTQGRLVIQPAVFFGLIIMSMILTAMPLAIAVVQGYHRKGSTPELEELEALEKKLEAEAPPPIPVEQQIMSLPEEERRISLKQLLSPSSLLARKINPRTRVLVLVGSVVTALALILVATFGYPTYLARPGYDNAMVVIFIVVLIPPSVLDVISRAYLKQIDSRIPDFLRDIADSQRTGIAFTKSLTNSALSNYGALTKELRKAMAKMSLGFTFEEALDSFADSAETPLAHRAAVLLKEVGRSGGKMLDVLDSVYEHIREVITLEKERSKQLSPYIIVIYASFGVYIFVVFILFSTFFAQVKELVSSGAPFGTNINPSVYYIWFYHMSIIEALFGGLVAGKISTGTALAGLKHMLVLLLISFVAFTFFIQV
ncbi:MAG: type II secretion system F family protein [Thaumarchaeota archaeon]|nr:type II secretion system F family protein [Nitrososphaerota archaeon]